MGVPHRVLTQPFVLAPVVALLAAWSAVRRRVPAGAGPTWAAGGVWVVVIAVTAVVDRSAGPRRVSLANLVVFVPLGLVVAWIAHRKPDVTHSTARSR
ncbi:hypothetical protein JOF53_002353 [Crossiella equi]|uniref:Integral membrane protein n=1 Tax=Crossiella equi TaxID=130796 RepID=A0ABS5AAY4_9PSEU|nr:hypothetical protein [Crossiella equi]MBP2473481.1 hypothetical protein [Crossiella equi]